MSFRDLISLPLPYCHTFYVTFPRPSNSTVCFDEKLIVLVKNKRKQTARSSVYTQNYRQHSDFLKNLLGALFKY